MAVNRVSVIWSGPTVIGGGLSTFFFETGVGTAQQQVNAVAAFLASTETQRTSSLTWATSPDVATLDQVTGTLTATTTTTPATGVGTAAGDPAPFATQGLLRLVTPGIVAGRLLRGRLFLPGVVEASSTGVPSAGYITAYNTPAATLIADVNSTWVVWSRTHGLISTVSSASTWNRWAVLRSRRD